MPLRLTSPSVGLMPTMPLMPDGQTTEPSVSVPTATTVRFAAAATAEPLDDPQGVLVVSYGFRVCPPRLLQPLDERFERKLAHSLRLALPRITAPASRSRLTRNASPAGACSASASEPALVTMRSAVSMFALRTTGMPCSGPRGPDACHSRSRARAMSRASGLTSIIARSAGPERSMVSTRSRYQATSSSDDSSPRCIWSCRSAMLASE